MIICSAPFFERNIERQLASSTVRVQGSVKQVLERLFKTSTSDLINMDRELCEIKVSRAVILELEKKYDEAIEIYKELSEYARRKSENPIEHDLEDHEGELKDIVSEQVRFWRQIHHKTGVGEGISMLYKY